MDTEFSDICNDDDETLEEIQRSLLDLINDAHGSPHDTNTDSVYPGCDLVTPHGRGSDVTMGGAVDSRVSYDGTEMSAASSVNVHADSVVSGGNGREAAFAADGVEAGNIIAFDTVDTIVSGTVIRRDGTIVSDTVRHTIIPGTAIQHDGTVVSDTVRHTIVPGTAIQHDGTIVSDTVKYITTNDSDCIGHSKTRALSDQEGINETVTGQSQPGSAVSTGVCSPSTSAVNTDASEKHPRNVVTAFTSLPVTRDEINEESVKHRGIITSHFSTTGVYQGSRDGARGQLPAVRGREGDRTGCVIDDTTHACCGARVNTVNINPSCAGNKASPSHSVCENVTIPSTLSTGCATLATPPVSNLPSVGFAYKNTVSTSDVYSGHIGSVEDTVVGLCSIEEMTISGCDRPSPSETSHGLSKVYGGVSVTDYISSSSLLEGNKSVTSTITDLYKFVDSPRSKCQSINVKSALSKPSASVNLCTSPPADQCETSSTVCLRSFKGDRNSKSVDDGDWTNSAVNLVTSETTNHNPDVSSSHSLADRPGQINVTNTSGIDASSVKSGREVTDSRVAREWLDTVRGSGDKCSASLIEDDDRKCDEIHSAESSNTSSEMLTSAIDPHDETQRPVLKNDATCVVLDEEVRKETVALRVEDDINCTGIVNKRVVIEVRHMSEAMDSEKLVFDGAPIDNFGSSLCFERGVSRVTDTSPVKTPGTFNAKVPANLTEKLSYLSNDRNVFDCLGVNGGIGSDGEKSKVVSREDAGIGDGKCADVSTDFYNKIGQGIYKHRGDTDIDMGQSLYERRENLYLRLRGVRRETDLPGFYSKVAPRIKKNLDKMETDEKWVNVFGSTEREMCAFTFRKDVSIQGASVSLTGRNQVRSSVDSGDLDIDRENKYHRVADKLQSSSKEIPPESTAEFGRSMKRKSTTMDLNLKPEKVQREVSVEGIGGDVNCLENNMVIGHCVEEIKTDSIDGVEILMPHFDASPAYLTENNKSVTNEDEQYVSIDRTVTATQDHDRYSLCEDVLPLPSMDSGAAKFNFISSFDDVDDCNASKSCFTPNQKNDLLRPFSISKVMSSTPLNHRKVSLCLSVPASPIGEFVELDEMATIDDINETSQMIGRFKGLDRTNHIESLRIDDFEDDIKEDFVGSDEFVVLDEDLNETLVANEETLLSRPGYEIAVNAEDVTELNKNSEYKDTEKRIAETVTSSRTDGPKVVTPSDTQLGELQINITGERVVRNVTCAADSVSFRQHSEHGAVSADVNQLDNEGSDAKLVRDQAHFEEKKTNNKLEAESVGEQENLVRTGDFMLKLETVKSETDELRKSVQPPCRVQTKQDSMVGQTLDTTVREIQTSSNSVDMLKRAIGANDFSGISKDVLKDVSDSREVIADSFDVETKSKFDEIKKKFVEKRKCSVVTDSGVSKYYENERILKQMAVQKARQSQENCATVQKKLTVKIEKTQKANEKENIISSTVESIDRKKTPLVQNKVEAVQKTTVALNKENKLVKEVREKWATKASLTAEINLTHFGVQGRKHTIKSSKDKEGAEAFMCATYHATPLIGRLERIKKRPITGTVAESASKRLKTNKSETKPVLDSIEKSTNELGKRLKENIAQFEAARTRDKHKKEVENRTRLARMNRQRLCQEMEIRQRTRRYERYGLMVMRELESLRAAYDVDVQQMNREHYLGLRNIDYNIDKKIREANNKYDEDLHKLELFDGTLKSTRLCAGVDGGDVTVKAKVLKGPCRSNGQKQSRLAVVLPKKAAFDIMVEDYIYDKLYKY